MSKWSEIVSNIEELTFGVEFETIIPHAAGVNVGPYHRGFGVQQAPQFEGRPWKAERDGSIVVTVRGYQACEFVSPVLKGEAGVAHLLEFITWLNQIGAKVNKSCGFHIHVGVSGLVGNQGTLANYQIAVTDYVNKLARVASFYATALYAQTGTLSRENGLFCMKPGQAYREAVKQAKATKQIADAARPGRYQMLNLTNIPTRGTVEFRCFAGTLNENKVLVHLFSVLGICRVAQQLKSVPVWESKPLDGVKSVWNLLKVRPMRRVVACKWFCRGWKNMVAIALEMAAQYDRAKVQAAVPQAAPAVQPAAPIAPAASVQPATL